MLNWFPPMEAFYYKNVLTLRVFIPGVVPKDVEIAVTGNLLTINGERKLEPVIPPEAYVFSEVTYAKFERTLTPGGPEDREDPCDVPQRRPGDHDSGDGSCSAQEDAGGRGRASRREGSRGGGQIGLTAEPDSVKRVVPGGW